MSDGFDKEAEREKLREKFAEDEKKREHTQRMSELLLKGATMTNRHCEECGDPIFRHDGREFCPTCGNEVGGVGDDAAGDDGAGEVPAEEGEAPAVETATSADADAEGVDAAAENGAASGDAVDSAVGDARPDEPAQSRSAPSAEAPPRESPPAQRSEPQRSEPQRPEPQRPEPRRPDSRKPTPSRSPDDDEGIGAARASLTRTLTRFARAAEETDDPRRARDHLEAAREAAEALAALD